MTVSSMPFSAFAKQLMQVGEPARSHLALAQIAAGFVPSFMANKIQCYTEMQLDSGYYRMTYQTRPNYLCLGTDDDWGPWPLSIRDLQAYCSDNGAFIPPPLIVRNNWWFSSCKIPVLGLYGNGQSVESTPNILTFRDKMLAAMKAQGCSPESFIRCKKAYNSAPNSSDSDGPTGTGRVHFTGWWNPNGSGVDGKTPSQWGVNGKDNGQVHDADYADYSHGCDIVLADVNVNGETFAFDEICSHPLLWPLAGDQGPFNPQFPNVGPNALAFASTTKIPEAAAVPAGFAGSKFKTRPSGSAGAVAVLSRSGVLPADAVATIEEGSKPWGAMIGGVALAGLAFWGARRWLR